MTIEFAILWECEGTSFHLCVFKLMSCMPLIHMNNHVIHAIHSHAIRRTDLKPSHHHTHNLFVQLLSPLLKLLLRRRLGQVISVNRALSCC